MTLRSLSVIISGAAGIAAQIILLRELMVSFQGSEISLGIIFAAWLLFEALGCFLAGKIFWLKQPRIIFALTQILMSGGLVFGIFIARAARLVMGQAPGSGLGIDAMFIISALALLPVALPHGISFVWAGIVLGGGVAKPGKAYVSETLGTMAGGAVVTFVLIPVLHSFDLALVVLLLSAASAAVLFADSIQAGCRKHKSLFYLGTGLSVLALIPLYAGYGAMHEYSLRLQWEGQNLVGHKNTRYGNIAVVERYGEYTFFVDGQPVITAPFPDITRLEEFVHFTMLSHPEPQSVLIITGGAGGKIKEILKYPSLTSIDYVELDPMLLEKIAEFPTDLTLFEMNHPKVRLHFNDGRYFLETTPNFYDICLVGITNPADLQTNRFFTREFFYTVKERLNPGGVLGLALPSLPRADLVIDSLAKMNKVVYATISDVFPYVRVYPGESANLIIASTAEYPLLLDAASMSAKIMEKGLETALLHEAYIRYRTLPWWRENFYESIGRQEAASLNLDFKPAAVFESMRYFSRIFTPALSGVFDFIREHGLSLFLAGMSLIAAAAFLYGKDGGIHYSIFTTGFAGMLLDLVLIFAFQAIFGYVFFWIGILVSVLMAGAAAAAFAVTRALPGLKNPAQTLLMTDMAVTLFAFILPAILIFLHNHTYSLIPAAAAKVVFILLSFCCGLFAGAQYPLACRLRTEEGKKDGGTAGLLYGLDLLGGFGGGIIGSLFLLPLLGLVNACLIMAGIKASSAAILFMARGKMLVAMLFTAVLAASFFAGCASRNAALAPETESTYTFGEVRVCSIKGEIRFPAQVSKNTGWVQHLVYLSGYRWLKDKSALVSSARLPDLQKGFAALDWKLWDELWQGIDSEKAYAVRVYLYQDGRRLAARALVGTDDDLHVGDYIFLGCPYFDTVALGSSPAADCSLCPVFPLEQEALSKRFVRENGESGFEIIDQKMFPQGSDVEVIIKLPK